MNAFAFADDLVISAGDTAQMQVQSAKVESFCSWSGMALAPAKCEACAILHSHGEHSQEWSLIRPMLELLTIRGSGCWTLRRHLLC